jgi:hypothetical protein
MNESDADSLLKLLAQDPQPALSPYFEARLQLALEGEHEDRVRAAAIKWLVLRGGVASLILSVVILCTGSFPLRSASFCRKSG